MAQRMASLTLSVLHKTVEAHGGKQADEAVRHGRALGCGGRSVVGRVPEVPISTEARTPEGLELRASEIA